MKNVSIPKTNNDITVNDFLDIRFLQMPQIFHTQTEKKKIEGHQYRIVTTSPYTQMSDRAKLCYTACYDRTKLSNYRYNLGDSWYVDENLAIYTIYTIEDLMQSLNCSKNSVIRAKRELTSYGLLREVSQGASSSDLDRKAHV